MKNILMCYDDALVVDLVRISLEDKGVKVIGTANCQNITAQIIEHSPIAIILDLNMVAQPTEEISALLKEKKYPIVIFSSDINGRQNFASTGVDYFVKKSPFGFEELEKIVEQVIAREQIAA